MHPIRRLSQAAAHTGEFGRVRTIRRGKPIEVTLEELKSIRPEAARLTSLAGAPKRLDLPHGCFNAALGSHPAVYLSDTPRNSFYICVYRPDEYAFRVCILDELFNRTGVDLVLGITNCADPRLLWLPDGRLLMVYSSCDDGTYQNECIRGAILMDLNRSMDFITPVQSFRISKPGLERQKNWTPFLYDGKVHLVANVKPHKVYVWETSERYAEEAYCSDFVSPWFSDEFFRGNTPPVLMDDGNFLGTFHTVMRYKRLHLYDNGCYVFSGKPPFNVLRCGYRTYLPAEAAVEPYFRKAGIIKVCFPVGMIRRYDQELLISYGDNDSSVKIMTTTIPDMLNTTFEVY